MPQHPDKEFLANVVGELDGEPPALGGYDQDSVLDTAFGRCEELLATMVTIDAYEAPQVSLMMTMWLDGFATGVRASDHQASRNDR